MTHDAPLIVVTLMFVAGSLALFGHYSYANSQPRRREPLDLLPPEPEPMPVLDQLYMTVGDRELADSAINHCTETTEEES